MKTAFFLLLLFIAVACAHNVQQNAHLSQQIVIQKAEKEVANKQNNGSITFAVDTVPLASNLLTVYPIDEILAWKLEKEILYFPDTQRSDSLIPLNSNGLMETIHVCYDQHRPLILSPDIIWLTICQGVSIHVNQHFDSLEAVVFVKDKPDKLIARNDSLENEPKQWATLIADISNQTKKYTRNNLYDFFVPTFSTTTAEITTAYQITLLEVFKDAFAYIGESGCGIPSITLRGTTKDWESILTKLEVLDQFNLSAWKNELKPIIRQFIAASNGNVDLVFWKDIYKYALEYNGMYTTGWSIKFFPYLNSTKGERVWDDAHSADRVYKSYRSNPFLYGKDYRNSTLSLGAFPNDISEVNLVWKNYTNGREKEMVLYAGIIGAQQNSEKSLEPYISWAIADKDSRKIDRSFKQHHIVENTQHDEKYWSPKFAKNLAQPAIYDPMRFQSQEKSITYLKKIIFDVLAKDTSTSTISKDGMWIEIEIYSNGEIGDILIRGSIEQEQKLGGPILEVLKTLPSNWSPATAKVSEVLRLMDRPEDVAKIVPVNSKVIVNL